MLCISSIKHDLAEPILRAKIENMISPDFVLCYIPPAMAILGKKWKFWNLLCRKEAAAPLMSVAALCGFRNFEKKFKILEFF